MNDDDRRDVDALAVRVTALEQEIERLQHLAILDKSMEMPQNTDPVLPRFIAGEAFQGAQRPAPPAPEDELATQLARLTAAIRDLIAVLQARRSDTPR